MVGFPNKPMGFPNKNNQHLGCEMGVPPFKETPICKYTIPLNPKTMKNEGFIPQIMGYKWL